MTSGVFAVPAGFDAARPVALVYRVARRTGASRRAARALLEAALADAVLLDEVALLPPRQRFVVREMTLERRSPAEVAATTGWTGAQVLRLLNAGLSSITTRVHIGHLPRQAGRPT